MIVINVIIVTKETNEGGIKVRIQSDNFKRDNVASIGFVLPRRRSRGIRPWDPERMGGRRW